MKQHLPGFQDHWPQHGVYLNFSAGEDISFRGGVFTGLLFARKEQAMAPPVNLGNSQSMFLIGQPDARGLGMKQQKFQKKRYYPLKFAL